jgi:hypothetical protein
MTAHQFRLDGISQRPQLKSFAWASHDVTDELPRVSTPHGQLKRQAHHVGDDESLNALEKRCFPVLRQQGSG